VSAIVAGMGGVMLDKRYFDKELRFSPFAFQCDDCRFSSGIENDINNVKCSKMESVPFSIRYGFQQCEKQEVKK
jgi:hypothetical protein